MGRGLLVAWGNLGTALCCAVECSEEIGHFGILGVDLLGW